METRSAVGDRVQKACGSPPFLAVPDGETLCSRTDTRVAWVAEKPKIAVNGFSKAAFGVKLRPSGRPSGDFGVRWCKQNRSAEKRSLPSVTAARREILPGPLDVARRLPEFWSRAQLVPLGFLLNSEEWIWFCGGTINGGGAAGGKTTRGFAGVALVDRGLSKHTAHFRRLRPGVVQAQAASVDRGYLFTISSKSSSSDCRSSSCSTSSCRICNTKL